MAPQQVNVSWRVGVDLVHVPRLTNLLEDDAALERLFAPGELARTDPPHVAGCLAAKEAAAKALGITPPPWREIVVRAAPGGRPTVTFGPRLAPRVAAADCSIAHDGDYAVAIVLLVLQRP